MNKKEKIELVKKLYDELNISYDEISIERNEELKADFVWIQNSKGPGSYIIGDDGSYLFCSSSCKPSDCKKDYKEGKRS